LLCRSVPTAHIQVDMGTNASRHTDASNGPPVVKYDFKAHRWPPSDWNGDVQRFRTNAAKQRQPFASGSFRDVFLAWDTKTMQTVVAKKFRKGHPTEEKFWREDILAADVAAKYASMFNQQMRTSKKIRFIKPLVDYCGNGFGSNSAFKPGECVLMEPYLGSNYKKFNSNTGWSNRDCGVSMAALSHFSYHASNGTELLCDLQGVKDGEEYVLTDPVICSTSGKYGLTDLGKKGMVAFFSRHKCTSLCNPSWKRLNNDAAAAIPAIQGTTFKLR